MQLNYYLQLEHANGLSVLLTHLYVHSTKQLCTKACDGSNSTVMQHLNLLYIRTFTPPAIFLFFVFQLQNAICILHTYIHWYWLLPCKVLRHCIYILQHRYNIALWLIMLKYTVMCNTSFMHTKLSIYIISILIISYVWHICSNMQCTQGLVLLSCLGHV